MKSNQLTRGKPRRLMYLENKDGLIEGSAARIGWVTFSKTGLSVHYRGLTLMRTKGQGIRGNYFDSATGHEYWVSGVKTRGSNVHVFESVAVVVDDDAKDEYKRVKGAYGA